MLEVGAVTPRTTVDRAAEPVLVRVTARVIESPGTTLAVVTGMAAPGLARSMSTVPEATSVEIGVVESVNVPKVPRPATAAAAPRTPREPRTLRAVRLGVRVAVMSCSCGEGRGGVSRLAGTTLRRRPQALRRRSARSPQDPRGIPTPPQTGGASRGRGAGSGGGEVQQP